MNKERKVFTREDDLRYQELVKITGKPEWWTEYSERERWEIQHEMLVLKRRCLLQEMEPYRNKPIPEGMKQWWSDRVSQLESWGSMITMLEEKYDF